MLGWRSAYSRRRVEQGKPQFITWKALKDQFGWHCGGYLQVSTGLSPNHRPGARPVQGGIPGDVVAATRERYVTAYEKLAGEPFSAWLERSAA